MSQNDLPEEYHPNLKMFNLAFLIISFMLITFGFSAMISGSSAGWLWLLGVLNVASFIYVHNKTEGYKHVDNGVPGDVKILCWLNAIFGFLCGFLLIYIIKAALFSIKENS